MATLTDESKALFDKIAARDSSQLSVQSHIDLARAICFEIAVLRETTEGVISELRAIDND